MKKLEIIGGGVGAATEKVQILSDRLMLQVDGAGRYVVEASVDGDEWSSLMELSAMCADHSRTVVVDLLAGAWLRVVCASGAMESVKYAGDLAASNEEQRMANEDARVDAEAVRVSAEQGRVDAEAVRVSAEQGRAGAEAARVIAEDGRSEYESVRVANEAGRVEAEGARVIAEEARALAEASRDAHLRDVIGAFIPTGIKVDCPERITMGNLRPRGVEVEMLPEGAMKNVMYLSDNSSVMVWPDGRLEVTGKGKSVVHVVPTMNTALARSFVVDVVGPGMRMTQRKGVRLLSGGGLRLT